MPLAAASRCAALHGLALRTADRSHRGRLPTSADSKVAGAHQRVYQCRHWRGLSGMRLPCRLDRAYVDGQAPHVRHALANRCICTQSTSILVEHRHVRDRPLHLLPAAPCRTAYLAAVRPCPGAGGPEPQRVLDPAPAGQRTAVGRVGALAGHGSHHADPQSQAAAGGGLGAGTSRRGCAPESGGTEPQWARAAGARLAALATRTDAAGNAVRQRLHRAVARHPDATGCGPDAEAAA